MIKKLLNKWRMYKNPVAHARKRGVTVGERCKFITPTHWGSEPWLITIGNHVEFSANVTLLTHDGATWVLRDLNPNARVIKYGKIIIHDNCFIGRGTTIMPGVEIGENSIIGACSLVTKSVPANSVYAGNPAHFICSTEDYVKKCIEHTPEFDLEHYTKDKQAVVKSLLKDKLKI